VKRWIIGIIMLVLVIALGYPLMLVAVILASPQPLFVGTGSLASCPPTPNCVSSLTSNQDQYVAPIPYTGEAFIARSILEATLASMTRTVIIESNDNYIHAIRRSPTMRFIDDVEFVFDDDLKVINVRAAARLGQGDLGQNRLHVESIRDQFTDNLAASGAN
jgi:uncharacterized protein (DUF1499 family)